MSKLALYLEGKNRLSVQQIDDEKLLNNDERIVTIKACGICGSDIEYINNNSLFNQKEIIGHEIVGVVKDDNSFRNKVAVNPTLSCYQCYQCKSGRFNLCENMVSYGRNGVSGGFRQEMCVHKENIQEIDYEISVEAAVLIEPLAVCLNAIKMSDFQPNMNVAVIGCGTIGLILIRILKSMGANTICAYDIKDLSINYAYRYGADYAFSAFNEKNIVMKNKVDLVFEVSGTDVGKNLAIDTCLAGGKIVLLSKPVQKYSKINYYDLFKKELEIKVVRGFNNCFAEAVKEFKKYVEISEMVTHCLSIYEAKNFLEQYSKYKYEVIKAAIIF